MISPTSGTQEVPDEVPDRSIIHNLRFGDGPLFKSGEGDSVEENGKTLRGRYIVRVGWDDVRGWMGEVPIDFSFVVFKYLLICMVYF